MAGVPLDGGAVLAGSAAAHGAGWGVVPAHATRRSETVRAGIARPGSLRIRPLCEGEILVLDQGSGVRAARLFLAIRNACAELGLGAVQQHRDVGRGNAE